MTVIEDQPRVGHLLRVWRERRRLSQLDLASQADVSARHLSFVETGRARPSSQLILRLTDHLDVPLRERNRLLLAGGFAPAYSERALDAPQMDAVRTALRLVLEGHEPYPALVVDRHWNLLEANAAVALLTADVAPDLVSGTPNVLRLSLHPDGLAPRIVNLGEWRAHLLSRLKRQALVSADPELVALHAELKALPCDQPEPVVELPGPGSVLVPLRLRHDGRVLSLLSMTAVFGTPMDVNLAELAIESFYPADAETAELLRSP